MGCRSIFMNYYSKFINKYGYGKTIDIYVKDIPGYIEQLKYAQWRLDTETPAAGVYHDWQVVKNALPSKIEKVKASTDKFIKEWEETEDKYSEEASEKFYSKALDIEYDWEDAWKIARQANAIFARQSYCDWKANGGSFD